MKIRKAVFPVAGLGTRVLPATKAMPKEMLTIVDKPLIQYVVDEAREAGKLPKNSAIPAAHRENFPERIAAALKPANLDFVPAASVPMVALTTWQALKERANVKPGQRVFIPAGAGGIGTFAIQLTKHLGAKVATTTSAGNVALVRSLGADEVIDYQQQEFENVLRDYDVVLGTLKGDSIEKSLQILRPKGKVVSLIGPPDAAFGRARGMNGLMVFVFGLLSRKIIRRATKRGVEYSFLFVHPDGRQLAEIGKLLESGRIRPVIDKVFPFAQAKDALAYLEKGRAKGKVVVQIR